MGQTLVHGSDETFATGCPNTNMVLKYWLKERPVKDNGKTLYQLVQVGSNTCTN